MCSMQNYGLLKAMSPNRRGLDRTAWEGQVVAHVVDLRGGAERPPA